MKKRCSGPPGQLFHEDIHGGVVVEGDAIAIHGAEEWAPTPDFGDNRGFAKAELTHALAELGASGEFTHATRFPSGQLAQRQEFRQAAGHGGWNAPDETRFQSQRKQNATAILPYPAKNSPYPPPPA